MFIIGVWRPEWATELDELKYESVAVWKEEKGEKAICQDPAGFHFLFTFLFTYYCTYFTLITCLFTYIT